MRKWLMSCVLPGVLEVLASLLWLVSILMRDDFPTLERPMNAYSGRSGLGQPSTVGLLMRYVALVISIYNISAISSFFTFYGKPGTKSRFFGRGLGFLVLLLH
jgi:hypothetical protein